MTEIIYFFLDIGSLSWLSCFKNVIDYIKRFIHYISLNSAIKKAI